MSEREFSGPEGARFRLRRNPNATKANSLRHWWIWWRREQWNPFRGGWAQRGYVAKPVGEAFVGGSESGK